jgi:integrase/recombinase XerD
MRVLSAVDVAITRSADAPRPCTRKWSSGWPPGWPPPASTIRPGRCSRPPARREAWAATASPPNLTVRAVEKLIGRYVAAFGLDPSVTAHSLSVTARTTARERGSDIIDLQDFAGHADPRTTLTYIRSRDRLSKSPAYVLKY